MKKNIDKLEDYCSPISAEEEAYRRGFAHGWEVAKSNTIVTRGEIAEWRGNPELVGAPGTFKANKEMRLKKEAVS